MTAKQELPLQVRVDLGVMVMKGYSTLSRSLKLEPNLWMQFTVIPSTPLFWVEWGSYSPAENAIEVF